jgi:hypothetical protein
VFSKEPKVSNTEKISFFEVFFDLSTFEEYFKSIAILNFFGGHFFKNMSKKVNAQKRQNFKKNGYFISHFISHLTFSIDK